MQKQIINDNQRAILESYAEGDYAPLFVEATTQRPLGALPYPEGQPNVLRFSLDGVLDSVGPTISPVFDSCSSTSSFALVE